MRRTRVGIAILAAAATTTIAASAAIALSASDAPSDGGQPGDLLATGSTVGGEPYTIARMSETTRSLLGDAGADSPSGDVCLEVKAHGFGSAGCIAPPDGEGLRPTYTTLGEDMIVYVLAGADVERLEVQRTDGQGDVASSDRSADLGDVRLLHTVLHVPAATLPIVDGTPVSPDIAVKALDSAGEVVDEQILNAARTGPS